MEETDFHKKYYFGLMKIVTVVNPRSEDYTFGATIQGSMNMETGRMQDEQRTYQVKAGTHQRLPGPIANMYLDQMSKLIAQDDNKFQFMIDFALKAQYYDDLIIDVQDIIDTYQPMPQYLQKEEVKEEIAEAPFAGKDSNEHAGTDNSTPEETNQGTTEKTRVGRPKGATANQA